MANAFVDRAANLLRAARAAGLTVVHVQVAFRPGLPEVSERNKLFGAVKASPREGHRHDQLVSSITPAGP